MSFKLIIHSSWTDPSWPDKIRGVVPDCEVVWCDSVEEAAEAITNADAAFGDIPAEVFRRARKLRWIQADFAGLGGGYFHKDLVESDVIVTNMREIYNDHLANQIMAMVLAFARGLPQYWAQQQKRQWGPSDARVIHLREATAVIIGVGGIGAETARLCVPFGIRVIGIDPRRTDRPLGVAELWPPERLDEALGQADFVIMTAPETPATRRMFNRRTFGLMKRGAIFINISRGACAVLDDLVPSLESGQVGGAGLDVFEVEPLPADHPLWTLPNVIITPHMGAAGPYIAHRRTAVFLDNCGRFARGDPLRNVVDKRQWF